MAIGRPRKFQDNEELQKQIDAYFAECDKKEEPYTISGLALALDTNRQTLIRYEELEDEGSEYLRSFSDTIKKAKQRVESYAEKSLYSNRQVAGVIFSLKNNYGWRDNQEQTTNINILLDGGLSTSELEHKARQLLDDGNTVDVKGKVIK